jgi:ATP-dependent exoDNAse (exonuclease V) beta subunit
MALTNNRKSSPVKQKKVVKSYEEQIEDAKNKNKHLLRDTTCKYNLDLFKQDRFKFNEYIEYDDKHHTYTHTLLKKRYTSVTTLIGKYAHKFESDKFKAKSTMDKFGMTYEEVLKYWDNIRDQSTNRGSAIHYSLDKMLNNNEIIESIVKNYAIDDEIIYYLEYMSKIFDRYKECKIHAEEILYSHKHQIAGQADLVIEGKDFIEIHDYKTNDKELKYEGYNNQMMKSPIKEQPSGDLGKYELQLNIYALFAEQIYKKPVTKLVVHHLRFVDNQPCCKEIELKINQEIITKLLNHYVNE